MSSSFARFKFAMPLAALTPQAFVNVADHYNKESSTREAAIHLYKAAISLSPNKICVQAYNGLRAALVIRVSMLKQRHLLRQQ